MLISKSMLPDADVVDQAIHKLTRSRASNLHGLAWSHQSGLAFEGNRLLAIGVEIKPAFLLFIVYDEGDQIPAASFEIAPLSVAADVVFVEVDLRVDPTRAVADVAVDFVGVHFHVEVEFAAEASAEDSRKCRLLRQPDPGRHRERADLEIGRMGNADVVSLRAVKVQRLAKFSFVRHSAVNHAVMLPLTVACLTSNFVKFPVRERHWEASDAKSWRFINRPDLGDGDEPKVNRNTEFTTSTKMSRIAIVGKLHGMIALRTVRELSVTSPADHFRKLPAFG